MGNPKKLLSILTLSPFLPPPPPKKNQLKRGKLTIMTRKFACPKALAQMCVVHIIPIVTWKMGARPDT